MRESIQNAERRRSGDMATSNNVAAREARRRKILERGSDRLALITGRIEDPTPPPSDHISPPPGDESGDFGSISANGDASVDGGRGSEAPVQRDSTRLEASIDTASDILSNTHPSSSSAPSSLNTEQYLRTPTQTIRFFTPTQITSAIAASKRSRFFASVVIAILVVLSHSGQSLIGSSVLKSFIGFRPLYLIMVTDLTLVFARILFNNQRGSGRPNGAQHSIPSTGGSDWTEQARQALEAGLAMQKAIDAIVMDCSLYTLITICGISLIS